MKCPHCKRQTRVLDTRPTEDETGLVRRRECLKCKARFRTVEEVKGLETNTPLPPGRPAKDAPGVVIVPVTPPKRIEPEIPLPVAQPATKRQAARDHIARLRDARRTINGH